MIRGEITGCQMSADSRLLTILLALRAASSASNRQEDNQRTIIALQPPACFRGLRAYDTRIADTAVRPTPSSAQHQIHEQRFVKDARPTRRFLQFSPSAVYRSRVMLTVNRRLVIIDPQCCNNVFLHTALFPAFHLALRRWSPRQFGLVTLTSRKVAISEYHRHADPAYIAPVAIVRLLTLVTASPR